MSKLSKTVLASGVACAAAILSLAAPTISPIDSSNRLTAVSSEPAPKQGTSEQGLLDQYSSTYQQWKLAKRKVKDPDSFLPAHLASTVRTLEAERENQCKGTSAAGPSQDTLQARRDAGLSRRIALLNAQLKHEQDSIRQQAQRDALAHATKLEATGKALSQVLRGKRQGFNFRLHGITYQAYIVELKTERIELHLNADSARKTKFGSLERLRDYYEKRGIKPAMLTNAGMFHANQEPVGLFIAQGLVHHPLNIQNPATDENFYLRPNGVFFVDSKQIGHIDSTGAYARLWQGRQQQVVAATQSGPMLVINNRLNAHFSELSTNSKVRSGVGIINSGGNEADRVLFLTTEGTSTFYDFARVFRDLFGCSNALFLDGAISKMYLAQEATKYTGGFFGPLIAVVPQSAPAAGKPSASKVTAPVTPASQQPGALPARASKSTIVRDSATRPSAAGPRPGNGSFPAAAPGPKRPQNNSSNAPQN